MILPDGYSCRILADSMAPSGFRLTTFEVTYPRFVHSELMTHRMLSRNAASSRAIPFEKMLERLGARPVEWGKNQKGMQAGGSLDFHGRLFAEARWNCAEAEAIEAAKKLHDLGLHKQIVNRLLEPFQFITTLISATDFRNFFKLRNHAAAQPELRVIAAEMQRRYEDHIPTILHAGDWHLPLIFDDERKQYTETFLRDVSVGRCARVSYLTHDGKRDVGKDIELAGRLSRDGHWSPFEHVAVASESPLRSGNFQGWMQYRKTFVGEDGQ